MCIDTSQAAVCFRIQSAETPANLATVVSFFQSSHRSCTTGELRKTALRGFRSKTEIPMKDTTVMAGVGVEADNPACLGVRGATIGSTGSPASSPSPEDTHDRCAPTPASSPSSVSTSSRSSTEGVGMHCISNLPLLTDPSRMSPSTSTAEVSPICRAIANRSSALI